MLSRLRSGLALLKPNEFAARLGACPFCGPTLFVRLRRDAVGVRCVRCAASAIHLAMGAAITETVGPLARLDVCELSARGPLAAFLRRSARSAALSEYFADAAPGSTRDGVRNEDMQRLTYPDASFDLVTHTEVLEHVPDEARAFAELFRVLRPGGLMLFTVPLHGGFATVERARLESGTIRHLLEPVHHLDPLRHDGILAFRDYGLDILDRLSSAGFVDARTLVPQRRAPWLGELPVILARKPSGNTA